MVIDWGKSTEQMLSGHAPKAHRVRTAAEKQGRSAYELTESGRAAAGEHRKDLARAFHVSPSAISHRKNGDHKDPVAQVCQAVMEVGDDTAARALLAAVEAAYERRSLLISDTPLLLNKYVHLWNREHHLDSEEDRTGALFLAGADPSAYDAALRRNGTTLLLLAEIRDELESRGVDTRRVLLEGVR